MNPENHPYQYSQNFGLDQACNPFEDLPMFNFDNFQELPLAKFPSSTEIIAEKGKIEAFEDMFQPKLDFREEASNLKPEVTMSTLPLDRTPSMLFDQCFGNQGDIGKADFTPAPPVWFPSPPPPVILPYPCPDNAAYAPSVQPQPTVAPVTDKPTTLKVKKGKRFSKRNDAGKDEFYFSTLQEYNSYCTFLKFLFCLVQSSKNLPLVLSLEVLYVCQVTIRNFISLFFS